METQRRMGQTMGHQREGDDRGSVDRPKVRRGTKSPPRTKIKGRKSTGGKVVPLFRQRRTGGARRGPARKPRSSTTGEAKTTVGHRRLWMVAAVFAMTGLLLGGRAVHISLTEDQNYRAFADEQGGLGTQVMAPTRGSIVSADGREAGRQTRRRGWHDREGDQGLALQARCGRPAYGIQRRRHRCKA